MNATDFREIDRSVLDRLHAVVGDAGVITDDSDKSPYLNDERGYYTGATPMIVDLPQPLWQHSSAWRITSTLPMHSKE